MLIDEDGTATDNSLPLTTKASGFEGVFTEVPHNNRLGLINDEQLRLFHLAVQDNRFSLTHLTNYLRRNISRYVFSRAEISEYETRGDSDLLGLDAVDRILAQDGARNIGELMLYIVLERILGAPKVLSKIELSRAGGDYRSRCDAIHLFTPDGDNPISSIVFGTSTVQGDMQDAIDEAFDKIVQIKSNQAHECTLVEPTVFTKSVDPSTARAIKDQVIPKPGSAPALDTSYGIFLAYSLGLTQLNYSSHDYRKQLELKLQTDISHHAAYIAQKIVDHGLGMHSFYIYVIPFDDSITDCASIMHQLTNPRGT